MSCYQLNNLSPAFILAALFQPLTNISPSKRQTLGKVLLDRGIGSFYPCLPLLSLFALLAIIILMYETSPCFKKSLF